MDLVKNGEIESGNIFQFELLELIIELCPGHQIVEQDVLGIVRSHVIFQEGRLSSLSGADEGYYPIVLSCSHELPFDVTLDVHDYMYILMV